MRTRQRTPRRLRSHPLALSLEILEISKIVEDLEHDRNNTVELVKRLK